MKTRILHTKFYQDSYILNLPAKERWLFIYLITNERVEKTGAYELPLPIAQLETGLTEGEILKGIEKFQTSNKIYYVDNYIVIKNILRYQNYSKGSAKQVESFEKEFENLPTSVKAVISNDVKPVTNQLPTSYQLVINNKEERIKNKKEKENKNFNEFWEKYPKKIARSKVEKKYPDEKHEEIMKGLEAYLKHWREKKTEMQYIPNPETWLNQERWNDELGKKIAVEPKKVKGIDFFGGYLNA